MNKIPFVIMSVFFLMSFVSGSILLEKGPIDLYNLKDKIEITAKIIPVGEINGVVIFYLSCESVETEVYKEYIYTEKEISKDVLIPLVKEFIGESKGNCVIKAEVNGDKQTVSRNFRVSDYIVIDVNSNEALEPGKKVKINGTAIRENGKPSEGTIELRIEGTNEIYVSSSVIDGKFSLEVPLPDNFKAGEHKANFKVYEQNSFGEVTNNGEFQTFVLIKQVPTNLEIILDSTDINPGETVKGEVLLRDQTGELISSKVYLLMKNQNQEVIDKKEIQTNVEFEYPIKYTQSPSLWSISAYSEDLITKMNFKILEKKEISIDIVNQTLIIENIGNVPYNNTVPVMIGDEEKLVSVYLPVGEKEKYSLSAPKGEYLIRAGTFERNVLLTGNAINVQKLSDSKIGSIKIAFWTFMVLLLGLFSSALFRQLRKKTFFGRRGTVRAKKPLELREIPTPIKIADTKAKAELSLSITGSKQNSPVGCILIKNYSEFKGGSGGVNETLLTISNMVEDKKGVIYENKGNIFFLIPPVKTKTFNNDMPLLELAQNIKAVLDDHNRKFKQKIIYGLSLNYGTIVTKEEKGVFKFMSMGTLMTVSKKLANKSNGEILMTGKFKERLPQEIRVENFSFEDGPAYSFKEIHVRKDNSTFIKGFLDRQNKLK